MGESRYHALETGVRQVKGRKPAIKSHELWSTFLMLPLTCSRPLQSGTSTRPQREPVLLFCRNGTRESLAVDCPCHLSASRTSQSVDGDKNPGILTDLVPIQPSCP